MKLKYGVERVRSGTGGWAIFNRELGLHVETHMTRWEARRRARELNIISDRPLTSATSERSTECNKTREVPDTE